MKVTLFIVLFYLSPAIAKTFRIAGIYPESISEHFNCTCGLEAQCMTQAAVKEARKNGVDVSLDLFDNERSPILTAKVSEKISHRNFDAVVGTIVSAEALPASRIFEDAKLPFIVPTASHPKVTEGKSYVTRVAFNDYRQAELLARLTYVDLGIKKAFVLRNASNPYSDFLGQEYANQFRTNGGTAIDYPLIDGFTDFKTVAEKILSNKSKVVFVPLPQAMLAALYVELAKRNAKVTLLGSDIVEGEVQFLKILGKTSPQIRFIFVKHWNGKFEGSEAKRFLLLKKKYCRQYTTTMTGVAAFDAISLILETLKRYPDTSKENLVPRLRSFKYDGMTGLIEYDRNGDPIKPLQLYTIHSNGAHFWREYP